MIYIGFALRNPWSKQKFRQLKEKVVAVSKNKTIEIGLYRNDSILGFSFGITARRDHAGFSWDIDLLGYQIDFIFYDNRHWDYREQEHANAKS